MDFLVSAVPLEVTGVGATTRRLSSWTVTANDSRLGYTRPKWNLSSKFLSVLVFGCKNEPVVGFALCDALTSLLGQAVPVRSVAMYFR